MSTTRASVTVFSHLLLLQTRALWIQSTVDQNYPGEKICCLHELVILLTPFKYFAQTDFLDSDPVPASDLVVVFLTLFWLIDNVTAFEATPSPKRSLL